MVGVRRLLFQGFIGRRLLGPKSKGFQIQIEHSCVPAHYLLLCAVPAESMTAVCTLLRCAEPAEPALSLRLRRLQPRTLPAAGRSTWAAHGHGASCSHAESTSACTCGGCAQAWSPSVGLACVVMATHTLIPLLRRRSELTPSTCANTRPCAAHHLRVAATRHRGWAAGRCVLERLGACWRETTPHADPNHSRQSVEQNVQLSWYGFGRVARYAR